MLPQNKIPPDIDEYVSPTSLDMALEALADGKGTPLAGGSDLWAQKDVGNGRLKSRLVNLGRVAGLRGITRKNGEFRLGAMVTMSEILESPLLAENVRLLSAVADRFASVQIRNVATLGGNIVNASPAADMVLPLIALGGELEICSKGNPCRREPLDGFFISPGKTRLAANELISAVYIKSPQRDFHGVFCKSGPRPALEISVVAMCLTGTLNDNILTDTRLVFGAVGPTPMRCRNTESLINGAELCDELITRAQDAMAGEIAPIDDFRASSWYRTRMAQTYLEQELIACR